MAPSQRGSRSSDNPGFNPGSIGFHRRSGHPAGHHAGVGAPSDARAANAVAGTGQSAVGGSGGGGRAGFGHGRRQPAASHGLSRRSCRKIRGTRKLCSARHDRGPCAGGWRLRTMLHLDFRCLSRHRGFAADDPNLPSPASIKPADMARGDSGETQPDASPPRPAH